MWRRAAAPESSAGTRPNNAPCNCFRSLGAFCPMLANSTAFLPRGGRSERANEKIAQKREKKKQGLLPRLAACSRDGFHRPRPSQHLACVASPTPKKAHVTLYAQPRVRVCSVCPPFRLFVLPFLPWLGKICLSAAGRAACHRLPHSLNLASARSPAQKSAQCGSRVGRNVMPADVGDKVASQVDSATAIQSSLPACQSVHVAFFPVESGTSSNGMIHRSAITSCHHALHHLQPTSDTNANLVRGYPPSLRIQSHISTLRRPTLPSRLTHTA
jgi:hypothetical protein